MPPRKFKIVFEDEAQDWFDKQTEDVQKRVLLILDSTSEVADTAGIQLENATRWYDDLYGWARRIRMDSAISGLRCIFFVSKEKWQMIIVKFGTHADDVYEDGN